MERTALVVGEDTNVLRLLEIKLHRAGFEVRACRDADSALRMSSEAGAVVVDDSIPASERARISEELSDEGDGRPFTLVLDARESDEDIARALRDGADDYVVKPFSPRDVVHRLRIGLLRRRLEAEHAK
jgi:two-component system OmpR family response regulator